MSAPADTATCPHCGADTPAEARFCPSCGARLEASSTEVIPPPPVEWEHGPVEMQPVQPHLFGVTPPLALLVLAGAALLLGVVLFALGEPLLGLVLLGFGFALLVVFAFTSAGERTRRVRERVRVAASTVGVRSAAAREATRLRHELARLESERGNRLRALGDAAYAGSQEERESARAAVAEVDERIASTRRELDLVGARVHERAARARLQVQPTEVVDPQQGSNPAKE